VDEFSRQYLRRVCCGVSFFVDTQAEHSVSHKQVVANGKCASTTFSDGRRYSFVAVRQNSTGGINVNFPCNDERTRRFNKNFILFCRRGRRSCVDDEWVFNPRRAPIFDPFGKRFGYCDERRTFRSNPSSSLWKAFSRQRWNRGLSISARLCRLNTACVIRIRHRHVSVRSFGRAFRKAGKHGSATGRTEIEIACVRDRRHVRQVSGDVTNKHRPRPRDSMSRNTRRDDNPVVDVTRDRLFPNGQVRTARHEIISRRVWNGIRGLLETRRENDVLDGA